MKKPLVLFLHGLDERLVDLVLSAAPSDLSINAMSRKAPHDEQDAAAREADFVMVYRAPMSETLLRGASRARLVQLLAAGYEEINVPLLNELGIPCANNGGANSKAVADQAVLMMLALYRRLLPVDRDVRSGNWNAGITGLNTFEMAGKTVGILGLGNIGREVARRVRAFEARVQYSGRTQLSAQLERSLDVRYVSLDELFASSDVLTLHCPLTPQTQGVVSRQRLAGMKPTSIIINTSRGQLVDEAALVETLQTGRILGAGLDSFEGEPIPADSALLALENVILSPHTGGTTSDTWVRRGAFAFRNIARVLGDRTPDSLVGTASVRRFEQAG